MTRALAALVALVAVGTVLSQNAEAATTPPTSTMTTFTERSTGGATVEQVTVVPWFARRACVEEDSVNCAWNAQVRGNRHGHSFITRRFPGRAHVTCIMFANRKYAAKHDHCWAPDLTLR